MGLSAVPPVRSATYSSATLGSSFFRTPIQLPSSPCCLIGWRSRQMRDPKVNRSSVSEGGLRKCESRSSVSGVEERRVPICLTKERRPQDTLFPVIPTHGYGSILSRFIDGLQLVRDRCRSSSIPALLMLCSKYPRATCLNPNPNGFLTTATNQIRQPSKGDDLLTFVNDFLTLAPVLNQSYRTKLHIFLRSGTVGL